MAVAESWRDPPPPEHDFCDDKGAAELKQKIEAYWVSRGFAPPQINLHHMGFIACMRSARTDIRSDMINGMPRKRSA